MIDLDVFTEQAEYIPKKSFKKWTISHQNEVDIVKKLTQGGAKLITGPRGCGKTTLMLKAYNNLISSKRANTLPVYVNFKSSLKLEPLYRNNPNAAYWFNQWLLLKVLLGLYESQEIALGEQSLSFLSMSKAHIQKVVELLEMGRVDLIDENEDHVSISIIDSCINSVISNLGKSRCALLLDDAGHAFSAEQQHDFFEFFREVKSKSISPKAAIYPGVTSYSSSFHVGHDAEEIDVWVKPTDNGYLDFMHQLLKSRFNEQVYLQLTKHEHLLNLMCYAAYGIPRSLLNMISELCKINADANGGDAAEIKLDNKRTLAAIKGSFEKSYQIYDSLRLKLPMYSNFIDTGASFFENSLKLLKEFNKGPDTTKQSSIIAIKRPISPELGKVIGFFQYSGIISPSGISSRGNKGVYELYELHYAAIIDRNVFFSSRGINVENYCLAFSSRPNHHYPRHGEQSLLEAIECSFVLALPACEVCKTPRLSDEARFCMSCGSKLKDASIFEDIVNQDISKLPITEARAQSIKESSKIRIIKDILMDHDNKELRSVRMIGPTWAKKIRNYAEEFIA
ncbi:MULTISPECIES: AAA family ATPase [Vibrio]|uniref:AAA family ATPase n=2 Tax=Vibrionaceae TaxID=641 RepID=UPI000C865F19|nr:MULTISPECIES: AAA family ATPase [Vibrio]PMP40040.1 hypothetical protein BCS86_02725 [Vibrio splendidus]